MGGVAVRAHFCDAVQRLIESLATSSPASGRSDDWPERDFATTALALLRGLNIGDLQPHPDAPTELRIHVRGKDRIAHASPPLTAILADCLSTRAARFGASRRAPGDSPPWNGFHSRDPLFINRDELRLIQGTLQHRVQRAYKRAGIEPERSIGALTHTLRHTFTTTMANRPDITIHALARMLGDESIATTQRYTEAAAALKPHYRLLTSATKETSQ
ncbi:tyrosine-type recombinase/integrase [Lolliginicoccus levis]|uniref:tyrosine-type recombinase/integrase n=1 Tax=Lolliginicoccus levis TaxID=2919542 RepID=UPI00241FD71F|nr:site-specific integrase [Lolliginicoccus levis]